jgi:hypothetical protein
MLEFFCCFLCLSWFSFLNFYNLSLDYLSYVIILEIKNDRKLFVENKNKKLFFFYQLQNHHHLFSYSDVSLLTLGLVPNEFYFILFFDTCQFLFEFILIVNVCWPNNYADMALGFSYKPLSLMTWCYLHYRFLFSCAESLDSQNFVLILQMNLTYNPLVVKLCNYGFWVVS